MPPRKPFRKFKPGTFAAVIRDYMATAPKWVQPPPQGYSEATKDAWRRELNLAGRAEILGAVSVEDMRPSLVQAFLDGLADRPGKQANALTALRRLEKWAFVRERLPFPITLGCEVDGPQGGHVPWSDEHVALAEAHARQDLSRVITMAANTGQRESDLVRMRWTDIEHIDGRPGINVTQQKTGKQIWVPFTEALVRVIDTWQRRPGFILLNKWGEQHGANALSLAWGRHRDKVAELKPLAEAGLVLHGLRATACVRLNQAGANSRQISDMIGMSEGMVQHYLRFSVQKENAVAAVIHLDTKRAMSKSLKNKGV